MNGRFFKIGLLAATALGGCREIRLNRAMEQVNDCYVRLFYNLESGDLLEIRAAARALQAALAEPDIIEGRDDEGYRRHLQETSDAASLILEEAEVKEGEEKDRERLLALRRRLFQSCQACHERYRR